jgi:protein gp37
MTTPRRFFKEKHWQEPLTWNRQAEKQGHRRSVFCASMADVYEDHPAVVDERQKLWKLIEATPWLNWLLLTKRPENILLMSSWGRRTWPDNVWVGTSVGLQKHAEERIPRLPSFDMCVELSDPDKGLPPSVLLLAKRAGGAGTAPQKMRDDS